ncbi:hypothetical protein C0585_06635 [Candidatus Woesearchaeota archaeon]|nr:MAG: hypothetical protein C0585_06635 [Candidatus Woesearchaeota archaeon]
MGFVNGLLDWTKDTFAPLGPVGLFILAFIESIFFPIPVDFLLIVLCLANPEMALFFAFITLLGSILGGAVGYKLGEYLGLPILKKMFSKKKIDIVHDYYEKYETLAVAIGGFTPLPYKLFAVSAGVFYIDFKKFIIVSSISRGARFFIVATLLMLYGVAIQNFIDKYFNIISIIAIIILAIVYFIYNKREK